MKGVREEEDELNLPRKEHHLQLVLTTTNTTLLEVSELLKIYFELEEDRMCRENSDGSACYSMAHFVRPE